MYSAPEALESPESYKEPADMWSIGILTYTLLAGFFPFRNDLGEFELRQRILGMNFNRLPFEHLPEEAVDFIECLIHKDPEKRLNSEEALNHVWIMSAH